MQPLWEFLEDHPLPDEYLLMDVEDDVIAALEKEEVGFEIVPIILELMAAYPLVDFGSPGSLTHFMEGLATNRLEEYAKLLLQSVTTSPGLHTLWLLNRMANVQKGADREKYLEVLRQIATNKTYPPEVRLQAQDFLDFQLEKEK